MASTLLIFVSFFVVFACALAFGVTYNTARIALSERGRELATLRVLGFTRAEISYILLGEIGAADAGRAAARLRSAICSPPCWCAASRPSCTACPFVITPATYGWAILVGSARPPRRRCSCVGGSTGST